MLWVDASSPSEDELSELTEVFGLAANGSSLTAAKRKPRLEQKPGYLVLTAVAVSDEQRDVEREQVMLDCFVGENWLLTVHDAEIAVIDDFRATASGEGELGILDAPSFLSDLLEWVVTSYLRAFDEIEAELENFDVEALRTPSRDPEAQIKVLIQARQRVGELRRSLAPHRDVFAALGHSEFDPLSSEASSERFVELTARLDSALASSRDVKDAIASSFDVLIVRTEHRTNEIIKLLTLVSILLLPGALLAGIAGMNVNFKPEVFVDSGLFWLVIGTLVAITGSSLVLARVRHWV
ncbi:MAG TPA: CorA family divalent cation transporter [Gaiellaceae bacterium]|nr:CorA family divalent cation transporter [Gaiellaceae bacterium]